MSEEKTQTQELREKLMNEPKGAKSLSSGEIQVVPEAMSWDVTARTEIGVYRQIPSRE